VPSHIFLEDKVLPKRRQGCVVGLLPMDLINGGLFGRAVSTDIRPPPLQ